MVRNRNNILACFILAFTLVDSASSWAAPVQVQYSYDGIGRLTAATYSAGQQLTYTYDAAGNLTRVGHSGGGVPVVPPDANAPVTVAPGASAVLSSPASVKLGVGSTLVVQAQAQGSTIEAPTNGNATVQLGSAGASVSLSAMGSGGKVKVLASPDGRGVLVLAYQSGSVMVGSTVAAQPLLDIGSFAQSTSGLQKSASSASSTGRVVLAGTNGGRIVTRQDAQGRLLMLVIDGTVNVPCGLLCAGDTIVMLARELATIGADGWPQKMEARVSTIVANVPGLELPADAPMLDGEPPLRAQGEMLSRLATISMQNGFTDVLQPLVPDPMGTLGWLVGQRRLNVLPLTQPQIQEYFQSSGENYYQRDGELRLFHGTLMMDVGPMPANPEDLAQALRKLDPQSLLRVQNDGVWRLSLKGQEWALRPDWFSTQGGHEGKAFAMDAAGAPRTWIDSGMQTPLYPALASASELRKILVSLDPAASLEVNADSSARAIVGGVRYGVQPLPRIVPIPQAYKNTPVWLESLGTDLLLWMPLDGGLAQGMRVWPSQ